MQFTKRYPAVFLGTMALGLASFLGTMVSQSGHFHEKSRRTESRLAKTDAPKTAHPRNGPSPKVGCLPPITAKSSTRNNARKNLRGISQVSCRNQETTRTIG